MFLRLLVLFLIFSLNVRGQKTHYEHALPFRDKGFLTEMQWDSLNNYSAKASLNTKQLACGLNKRVYGWHPYWVGTVYNNYQWNLISDLCYFDYAVSPTTGNNTNTSFAWLTSGAVTAAINNGVNVSICATLFSNHTTFLADATAKQTLISNLISLVQQRNGKGVNIDFEGMAAADKVPFTNFMIDLCNQMHAAIPGSEVTIALYAVDWGGVFDIATLNNYVDLFIIMGYDYYWSGSTTAGPTDPLYNFQTTYNYTLTKSITYYLNKGASKSKLLLGLPYYGREWPTSSGTAPSSTTASGNSVTFKNFKNNTNGYYSNRNWEANSFTPFYPYQVGAQWWQCFIDDAYSMGKRFDVVNQRGLGGIGIWALGYDDGYNDMWNKIQEKLSDCAVIPCSDTIYDMGGPNRNYYDNENFSYTISPAGAATVSLDFSAFDIQLNNDSLWLFDGPSTSSPLLGVFTGTSTPGSISSTGPSLTYKFKSNSSTVKPGWKAIWNCLVDNTPPLTAVSTPSGWITQNFNVTFNDTDNSGIEKSFYQVTELQGSQWRANNARGFFSDEFATTIHPDWSNLTGTWSVTNGALVQSDESVANSNIYASLNQNLSNRYLYSWRGSINGSGTNRRAGLHFFCDNATLTNRGNSYFVWFRVDQTAIEIYKVVNDVFSLVASTNETITAGTLYDFKISFDRVSGEIEVYLNDVYKLSWTDPSPHSTGSYISFRNGGSTFSVNDLKVFRSRPGSVMVSVGAANTNDLRIENPGPSTISGQIQSIVKDSANNLSSVVTKSLNIDFSSPSDCVPVNDGTAADIDTTFNNNILSANWAASTDINSALSFYEYSIGTAAGLTDVVQWTSNGTIDSVTHSGLVLTLNQRYYFNVRSTNGAGLVSNIVSSNGQVVASAIGIEDYSNFNFSVYPNPSGTSAVLKANTRKPFTVKIIDISGREIASFENISGEHLIQAPQAGVYFIIAKEKVYKWVVQ